MFDAPRQARQARQARCDYVGDKPGHGKRAPICNRMAGHDGPHRVYDAKAEILVEWS